MGVTKFFESMSQHYLNCYRQLIGFDGWVGLELGVVKQEWPVLRLQSERLSVQVFKNKNSGKEKTCLQYEKPQLHIFPVR